MGELYAEVMSGLHILSMHVRDQQQALRISSQSMNFVCLASKKNQPKNNDSNGNSVQAAKQKQNKK